jgi:hypothetical protein
MGTPASAILAEVYIQYMEYKQLYPTLRKSELIGYLRYVNDILIIYNQNKTNIDETLREFNRVISCEVIQSCRSTIFKKHYILYTYFYVLSYFKNIS